MTSTMTENQLSAPVALDAARPNLYRPSIHSKKDGLLLITCTGQGRFLTWLERLQLWLGLTDADGLERRLCRHANAYETDRSLDGE